MSDSLAARDKGGRSGVLLPCWECRSEVPGSTAASGHFCPECGKVQALAPGADYFGFFGLPRKLGLNEAALEKLFHQLSWQLHPDRFHNSSDYERELSLQRTAVLNDAFRTLRDPVARTEYLLRLEQVRKEGEVKQQAPPDLLEEVFELNEHLEELRMAKRSGGEARRLDDLRHPLKKALETFTAKLQEVLDELKVQFVEWDRLVETGANNPVAREAVLERLNAILNRHSYIRNLVRNATDELES